MIIENQRCDGPILPAFGPDHDPANTTRQVRQTYATYFCSPPVTNGTAAVLNLSGFEKGEDGGGRARCDKKYHSDDTPVVALSTGWFNDAVHCEQVILIRGKGGRTAQAVVVDECNSHVGCDNSGDYRPPCPNNVLAASKAVWAALGVPENSSLYGEMDVTWSPTNKTNPRGSYQLSQIHRSKIIFIAGIIGPLVAAALVTIGLVVCIHTRRPRWKELDEEQWENSLVLLSDDEEMRNNIGEVEKMIKLAIWCLQKEPTRRPSMSIVVRVLEGTIALEHMIDSSYATLIPSDTPVEISSNATFDVSSTTFPR
ncbi:hypothetical protein Cgig2_031887 [Carnegiea gigantea]|uniref:Uncharacterized protein n=1 Tax=Carnegiea gigantea TaxID=171969 RepID=A0A9Q1KRE4_9CARY|nr:hypothetical protein Cgig2_031887 [Carnegiea gigantea]